MYFNICGNPQKDCWGKEVFSSLDFRASFEIPTRLHYNQELIIENITLIKKKIN